MSDSLLCPFFFQANSASTNTTASSSSSSQRTRSPLNNLTPIAAPFKCSPISPQFHPNLGQHEGCSSREHHLVEDRSRVHGGTFPWAHRSARELLGGQAQVQQALSGAVWSTVWSPRWEAGERSPGEARVRPAPGPPGEQSGGACGMRPGHWPEDSGIIIYLSLPATPPVL